MGRGATGHGSPARMVRPPPDGILRASLGRRRTSRRAVLSEKATDGPHLAEIVLLLPIRPPEGRGGFRIGRRAGSMTPVADAPGPASASTGERVRRRSPGASTSVWSVPRGGAARPADRETVCAVRQAGDRESLPAASRRSGGAPARRDVPGTDGGHRRVIPSRGASLPAGRSDPRTGSRTASACARSRPMAVRASGRAAGPLRRAEDRGDRHAARVRLPFHAASMSCGWTRRTSGRACPASTSASKSGS